VVVGVHRARLRRFVIMLAVIASLGFIATDGAGEGADQAPRHFDLNCLPFRQPHDVSDVNALIARYRTVPGFVGADVGADVLLQDGRRMWVFGDTLRHQSFGGQHLVRNSILMFSSGCATVVMPSDRGAAVPDRPDGVGYWPMGIGSVRHAGYDIVGISLQRVRTTGTGIFDFQVLGPAIAFFKVPAGKAPELLEVRDLGADDANPERPMWGAAIATTPQWVYIYGTARPADDSTYGHSLQVARAPLDHVADQATWRYWDGRRWRRDPARAAVLIPAVRGVSQVLSVFQRDGTWYAVSKRDDVLGQDLVIWKAPAPTGPFVASAPLADIPSDSADGLLRYMPLAHPDLLPEAGSILVSYSRNVADFHQLEKDPYVYRPHFLRVPLP